MVRAFLIIPILLLISFHAQSANYHEHFRSLFLASNFTALGTDLFSINDQDQKLTEAFPHYEQLLLLLRVNFDLSHDQSRALIPEQAFEAMTFRELCERIPGDPKDNFKKLVEMNPTPKNASSLDLRRIYVLQEDIRTVWLKNLPKDLLEKLYRNYFETDAPENWREIHISVSGAYLQGSHKWRYDLFLAIAQQYGAKIKTFSTVHRGKIGKTALDRAIMKSADGLDIVASMFEDNAAEESKKMHAVGASSLTEIFDFAVEHDKELRIHAFEAASDGPFYEILKSVVKSYKKPIQIRIGHIAHLTPEWLKLFSKNPNLRIRFDVNESSNFWLQSRSTADIVSRIKLIQSYGYSVDLGSDGRGVLPKSSYLEQIKRLNAYGYRFECIQFYR